MKYEYTGRHIEVTPAIRSHVEEHFDRIGHLFSNKPTKAHVIIEVERGRHRSEIVLNWRKDVLTAETTDSDMYLSLSQTIGKLEKQALKLKNKVIDKSHKAKRSSAVAARTASVRPEPSKPRIIAARRYAVKPMAVDEAAAMLGDGQDSFLVFRNSDDDRISVIYKRKDANFGLIQP